jgi:hypothetical protein
MIQGIWVFGQFSHFLSPDIFVQDSDQLEMVIRMQELCEVSYKKTLQ